MIKTYKDLWLQRRDEVDCRQCHGDYYEGDTPQREACKECAWTGLEPIPWTELFMDLRKALRR